MQITIDLNENLLADAAQCMHRKTHAEIITIALQMLIETHQPHDLRELRGKVKINPDYDYKTMREGNT